MPISAHRKACGRFFVPFAGVGVGGGRSKAGQVEGRSEAGIGLAACGRRVAGKICGQALGAVMDRTNGIKGRDVRWHAQSACKFRGASQVPCDCTEGDDLQP